MSNLNITKNGFYKLSDFSEETITISSNLELSIFDNGNTKKDIYIGENSKVSIYGYINKEENYNINIFQKEDNSKLKVRYLLKSQDNKIKSKIYSQLSSNNTNSDIKIISIVGNDGFVDIDGIIEIDKDIKGVKGNLIEENLFLGNTGKVKGIPTLLVRSDDVQASHSCKMERISDEKLFYLRSRGIGKENALNMMLEAYIKDLFGCLGLVDKDFYDSLVYGILENIN